MEDPIALVPAASGSPLVAPEVAAFLRRLGRGLASLAAEAAAREAAHREAVLGELAAHLPLDVAAALYGEGAFTTAAEYRARANAREAVADRFRIPTPRVAVHDFRRTLGQEWGFSVDTAAFHGRRLRRWDVATDPFGVVQRCKER